MIADVLIVGSGASAVHAAFPLVTAGYTVRMLDVGNEDREYASLIPDRSFEEIRRTDRSQFRYFLGTRYEGIAFGPVRSGPQLTPPRQFVTKDTDELAATVSEDFFALQSLAVGGLASAWGAGVFPFTEEDLTDFPISLKELAPHYEAVAERIGVSGQRDDLLPFYRDCASMLPPLLNDTNAQTILDRYVRRRKRCHAAGIYIGQPRVAALSRRYRGRGPERYLNMSFWGDLDHSVYRPKYTLAELRACPNFQYHRPLLVQRFREQPDGVVEAMGINPRTGGAESHRGRKLVLAAGTLGTARIVLRSLNRYGASVPLLSNPYTYVPMLNLNMLGRVPSGPKHSLVQLCVVHAPPGVAQPLVHAHVHSYQSLLNFKLAREFPLPYGAAMRLAKWLVPCLAILAIDHEDRPGPGKLCRLRRGDAGGADQLHIEYRLPDGLIREQRLRETVLLREFLRFGCVPLRRIRPGYAASVHYGGTFPMTHSDKELTVEPSCRLRGARSVYLADGSVFPHLPAKGLTFTMMANANRIGTHLCHILKGPCCELSSASA